MRGHRRDRVTSGAGIGEVVGRPARLAVVLAVLLVSAVACQPKAPNDGRDLYASLDPLPTDLERGDYFNLTGSFGDAGSVPGQPNIDVTLILSPNLRFEEAPWREGGSTCDAGTLTDTVWRCAPWRLLGSGDVPLSAMVEVMEPGETFAILVVRSATKELSPDPTPNDAMVTATAIDRPVDMRADTWASTNTPTVGVPFTMYTTVQNARWWPVARGVTATMTLPDGFTIGTPTFRASTLTGFANGVCSVAGQTITCTTDGYTIPVGSERNWGPFGTDWFLYAEVTPTTAGPYSVTGTVTSTDPEVSPDTANPNSSTWNGTVF